MITLIYLPSISTKCASCLSTEPDWFSRSSVQDHGHKVKTQSNLLTHDIKTTKLKLFFKNANFRMYIIWFSILFYCWEQSLSVSIEKCYTSMNRITYDVYSIKYKWTQFFVWKDLINKIRMKFSRSHFRIGEYREMLVWLILNNQEAKWADVPDREQGDVGCQCAINISSCLIFHFLLVHLYPVLLSFSDICTRDDAISLSMKLFDLHRYIFCSESCTLAKNLQNHLSK